MFYFDEINRLHLFFPKLLLISFRINKVFEIIKANTEQIKEDFARIKAKTE